MLTKSKVEVIFMLAGIVVVSFLSYSIIPTLMHKFSYKIKSSLHKDKLYLTFDDGPHPTYTTMLLDLLDKYNVKASFFVVGEYAKSNPEIITRMKDDGHLICMHSLRHKNGLFQTPTDMKNDFEKSIKILDELGVEANYFRPPWGHFNLTSALELKKYNLNAMLWDVMAEDWRGNITSEEIMCKLAKRTLPGDIICLHDGRGKNEAPLRTINALDVMIPLWLSKGYSFDTVDKYEAQ